MLVIRLSVKAPCRQQWSEHPSVLQEHWQLVSPLLQVMRCSLCQTWGWHGVLARAGQKIQHS